MMTTLLIIFICILLIVIYVQVKDLQRAERDLSRISNEISQKSDILWEQKSRYSKLKRRMSRRHTGVEHQLFRVSILIERYSLYKEDIDAGSILSDLLLLQCFLLDLLEIISVPVNNPTTYYMRQQVREKCGASSWGKPPEGMKP